MNNFQDKANFIRSAADLHRGDFKQYEYQKVLLTLTVLSRLDCVLSPTKAKVLSAYEKSKGGAVKNLDPILNRAAGQNSKLDFAKLKDDLITVAVMGKIDVTDHEIQGTVK
jgi:type I restriction enzyme M protein